MKEDILKYCEFLIKEHNFAVIDVNYDSKSFGDFLIKLKSNLINVHYLRDRSQYSIQISSITEGHNLFQLESIMKVINNNSESYYTIKIDELNNLFKLNYKRILNLFSQEIYPIIKPKLEEIRRIDTTPNFLK